MAEARERFRVVAGECDGMIHKGDQVFLGPGF